MSEATIVNIMNTIRDNAGTSYQDHVPVATVTNIQDVANPILAYSPTQNEFLNTLVNRIALVIVRNQVATNPLRLLKKGSIPLGKDIEEIFTNMAEGEAYNPDGTGLLSRNLPDVKAAYHSMNRQGKYKVTITDAQLNQAFTSWSELGALITSIINSLYSGDNFDEFNLMKNLFARAIGDGHIVTRAITAPTNEATGKEFVKKVRTDSSLFVFPSSNFNKYSSLPSSKGKPVITWTPKDKQILLIRSDVMANIDVDVLAVAFNMEKTQFLANKIIEVDDFGAATNCVAILMDESFTLVYDNKVDMREFFNPDGLYWNYFFHHWQTYSYSPFANCVAYCLAGTPSVTSVTLMPNNANVLMGGILQLSTAVHGKNSPDQSCTYTISGNDDSTTMVDSTGRLYVGLNETGGTLTITATSVVDATKTASVNVVVTPITQAVISVDVTPKTATVEVGGTQQFTATVRSIGGVPTTTWGISAEEALNAGTTISTGGLLTVNASETNTSITVLCSTSEDASKFDEAIVTVVAGE